MEINKDTPNPFCLFFIELLIFCDGLNDTQNANFYFTAF
jgi:hypothetical protein